MGMAGTDITTGRVVPSILRCAACVVLLGDLLATVAPLGLDMEKEVVASLAEAI